MKSLSLPLILKPIIIKNLTFLLALISLFAFSSCEKELSEENGFLPGSGGGNSGTSVYTFDGAPGACASPVISGTYTVGTALNSSNTVVITVNVTTTGTYVVSTNTSNGISFAGSGSFTATGAQTITLTGSGTPTAATSGVYVPGTSGCSFNITATGGSGGTDFFRCKIDGVLTNFNDLASAEIVADTLTIGGLVNSTSSAEAMAITVIGTPPYSAGTYVEEPNGGGTAPYHAEAGYITPTFGIWYIDENAPGPRTNPFTIVITSISATRVAGTFSGGLWEAFGSGTTQMSITEGAFDVAIQ